VSVSYTVLQVLSRCQQLIIIMLIVLLGLLTVNPKERLNMQDLLKNEWINGTNTEVLSTTPLATPDVLSLTRDSVSTVQSQIAATMNAFHKAHRAGFRLQDVSNAPLVRRRKRKREECGSSGSTDSSRASTPVPPFTNAPSPLAKKSPSHSITSSGPGTGSFQPFTSVTQPASCASGSFYPLSMVLTSQSGSAVSDLLQQDDSTVSCGFSLYNSSPPHLAGLHHSSAAESSTSTPNHSPTSRQPTDGSSSSRGSTPQRSPVSRAASFMSLGFSPATSVANSNENSCHDCEPAAESQIPSSSTVTSSLASTSHSDSYVTISSFSDNHGHKRKLQDSCNNQAHSSNNDDDDCVIVGVTEGIISNNDNCKKPCTQL